MATRLPTAQQSLLGFVVDRGVRAGITLADGLTATISHGELKGGALDAWCEEAGDYLEFPLAEIVEVRGPTEPRYFSGLAFARLATRPSRKSA
ncbi:hypothetical protein [Nonomuraea salmonea]|uniref:hypothetical protein n=1 Tax=Nonomuraea salmonea TaxID=46181 RepID=UPI0031EE9E20